MALRVNATLTNSRAQGLVDIFNGAGGTTGATVSLYSGTQPGTAGAGTSGCINIAIISNVLWGSATGGTANLSALYSGTVGSSGTISWLRCESDGGEIIDVECGTAGTEAFVISKSVFSDGDVITLMSAPFVQS